MKYVTCKQCTEKKNSTEYRKQLAARIETTKLYYKKTHEPITKMMKHTKTGPFNVNSLVVYTTRHASVSIFHVPF